MEDRRSFLTRALVIGSIGSIECIAQDTHEGKDVLVNGKLKPTFDMGVDDNEHQRKWLSKEEDHMLLSYPAGLEWGAVFVTFGKPKAKDRPFIDLSDYRTLIVEMRGGLGGEQVAVGIKTNDQEDDGSETKFDTKLSKDWQEYKFPLSQFSGASPSRLYVVAEFVFSDAKAQTVLVRNIRYVKAASK